jgi:hypothetical protein
MIYPGRFIVKEVDSDLLFYDPDSDQVHILNPTARTVYELLLENRTEGQIVEALQATRDGQGEDIEMDVRKCIEGLIEKGLIDLQ